MARRVVPVYEGTPTLTEDKVATFKEWLRSAMGDEDKAGSIDDACYYEGVATAMKFVLDQLYDIDPTTNKLDSEAVEQLGQPVQWCGPGPCECPVTINQTETET